MECAPNAERQRQAMTRPAFPHRAARRSSGDDPRRSMTWDLPDDRHARAFLGFLMRRGDRVTWETTKPDRIVIDVALPPAQGGSHAL